MFTYTPQGVCSREISFEIVDGKVHGVHFEGGCNGNGKAVSALCEGHTPEELISILRGIQCKTRGTSCADQLSHALEKALESAAESAAEDAAQSTEAHEA